jgi:hypothetical protein
MTKMSALLIFLFGSSNAHFFWLTPMKSLFLGSCSVQLCCYQKKVYNELPQVLSCLDKKFDLYQVGGNKPLVDGYDIIWIHP